MTRGEASDDPTSNDDYVARLLASEAKDKSLKYSALGLQAYLPRRPTERAPKPNTRFLKNILRDTDSHNAALRRKEEEEARERMRKLRGDRSPYGSRSERHQGRERSHRNRSPHRREKEHSSKRIQPDGLRDTEYKSRSKRHRRHREHDSGSDREGSSRSHRRQGDSSRSGHRSSRYHRDKRSASPRRSRSRSHSRSRSPDASGRKPANGNSHVERNGRLRSPTQNYNFDSESDPLEDIVGPLPASSHRGKETLGMPTRGRGSYRAKTSTIDSHFAHDYDPKLDVDISDNDEVFSSKRPTRRHVAGLMTADDDWGMALQAVRDRALWKQQGEDRLRAAGFDESTVQRWKQEPAFAAGRGNDTEGNVADVKWAKHGEGREWDRGKVLNDDGHYDVKAQW